MKHCKQYGTAAALFFAAAIFALFLLTGCATPPRHTVQAATPVPVPTVQPVTWQPVIDTPPSPPALIEEAPARPKPRKVYDVMTATTITFPYDPGRQYRLVCPEWALLTIRLLPGEVLQDIGAGNPVEWMIQPSQSSWQGQPVSVILIKRGPQAPSTDVSFVTDQNIYQVRLSPTGRGENKDVRLVLFRDPDAEARKEEQKLAAEARRQQQAREPRYPSLNIETARQFQVTGDDVPWYPVSVTGDDKRTFVTLPGYTGAAVPTLSVIRDGEEARVNYRTIPKANGGSILIADEAVNEARLIGQDGAVTIRGGN